MSWNGTLSCSYCYTRGHSKRKCPEMKKKHDEYVKLTEAGEPVNWRQRSAHDEYKEMQESLKESNKQCAYCNDSGHRVLTCPSRLAHDDKLRQINKWWKPFVAKTLRETGFGLGCLVNIDTWCTIDGEHKRRLIPHLVLGHEKNAFDFTSLTESFGNVVVMDTISMDRRMIRMPDTVQQKLCLGAFSIKGLRWTDNPWRDNGDDTNPFQRKLRDRHLCTKNVDPLLSPSEKPFSEQQFFPLKTKRDINKMFREHKKRGDSDRFYTQESTGRWVSEMYDLLKKHRVIK